MIAYRDDSGEHLTFPTGASAHKFPETFGAQCVEMVVEPGGKIPVHAKPVNVLFYVLEGEITAIIGSEKATAGPGTLVESPVVLDHGLINESTTVSRVLIIKLPQ